MNAKQSNKKATLKNPNFDLFILYYIKARNLSETEYFICHKGHWCLFCLLQAPYSIDTILLTPIGAYKIANNLQNVGMCCEFPVQAIK